MIWLPKLNQIGNPASYRLKRSQHCCQYQHRRQRDRDLLIKLVHPEEEGHEADSEENAGLQQSVGQVVLNPALEDEVDGGRAEEAVLEGEGFVLDHVLDVSSLII